MRSNEKLGRGKITQKKAWERKVTEGSYFVETKYLPVFKIFIVFN